MSASGASDSRTWTCVHCGVVASFDPPRSGLPDGWAEDEHGWLCLGCRREKVLTDATGESREVRQSDRRRALTEFELIRDPDASDGVVARRARTSSAMVRPVRARLREAGRLRERE